MTTSTRRAFLKTAALGIAGAGITALITGRSGSAGEEQAPTEPFSFLALADMHLTDAASAAYPSKVIKAMNGEGGALVLACGDLASKPTREELVLAKGVLDELKAPYYPTPGNHDALFRGDKEETLFREIFSLENANYHFTHHGVLFIGIAHGCGKAFRKNAVRPDVMTWLKDTLKTVPDTQPIVLFTHYPFGTDVRYRTENADDVLALFKRKKLLAIISGHFHGNTEKREDGILMTTTACSSGTRGNHDGTKAKGYRAFHVDKDMNITTEFKEVEV